MTPFSVSDSHRLLRAGEKVRFEAPRQKLGSPMRTRRFLVMHFTAGWGLESTIDWWREAAAKGACAHVIIDRDGTVVQCRQFNQTAAHAGVSRWRDPNTGVVYKNLNSCSIGIELCNIGHVPRETYPTTMGIAYAGEEIPWMKARHKNGGPERKWELFNDAQLESAEQVAEALVKRYKLDDVVGHDDIAPSRKDDPGPAFPMESFRRRLGFFTPLTPA